MLLNNNVFTVYELDVQSQDLNSDFTLKDCLFGGVKLATNTGPDNDLFSGYGIVLNSCPEFLLVDSSIGKKKPIIFRVDISSSVHIGNGKKYLNP